MRKSIVIGLFWIGVGAALAVCSDQGPIGGPHENPLAGPVEGPAVAPESAAPMLATGEPTVATGGATGGIAGLSDAPSADPGDDTGILLAALGAALQGADPAAAAAVYAGIAARLGAPGTLPSGSQSLAQVVAHLSTADPQARSAAFGADGRARNIDLVAVMQQALRRADADPRLRLALWDGLVSIGTVEAITLLLNELAVAPGLTDVQVAQLDRVMTGRRFPDESIEALSNAVDKRQIRDARLRALLATLIQTQTQYAPGLGRRDNVPGG